MWSRGRTIGWHFMFQLSKAKCRILARIPHWRKKLAARSENGRNYQPHRKMADHPNRLKSPPGEIGPTQGTATS